TQIDPTLAEPHAVMGLAFINLRKHRESNQAFARALALDPDDVTANFWRALTLLNSGYRRQGIAALDRTLQLDPLLPNALLWRGRVHVEEGELDQGERLIRRAAEGGHGFVGIAMARLEMARGNRDAAVSQMEAGLKYFTMAFPAGTAQVFARAFFGDPQAKARALVLIDAYLATRPAHITSIVSAVLIHVGEPARGFSLLQDRPSTNDSLVMGELFSPPLAAARRVPEFAEFVRRMGLAAYWDEAGPPDQCRKNANGDYACE
ncbi:MAG TPA: tetratricopeptide repeat protein, partial [Xanthomonadales bacterium]|nr:tetratricopeptide repeat protein [Xanthomonadales bacterium]